MASVKKAKPSSENGMPIAAPANPIKCGHNNPSSSDKTVPETAPIANRIAVPLAHRFARHRYAASRVRSQRASAMTIMRGSATPMTAKMIWKASDIAIWERAAKRSLMKYYLVYVVTAWIVCIAIIFISIHTNR
jgi:predicted protein tyrosine phosphatase